MHARVLASISCRTLFRRVQGWPAGEELAAGQLIQDGFQQLVPHCLLGKCSCQRSGIQAVRCVMTCQEGLLCLQGWAAAIESTFRTSEV